MRKTTKIEVAEQFFMKNCHLSFFPKEIEGYRITRHTKVTVFCETFIDKTKRKIRLDYLTLKHLLGKYIPVHSQDEQFIARILVDNVCTKTKSVTGLIEFKSITAMEEFKAANPHSTGFFINPLLSGTTKIGKSSDDALLTTKVQSVVSVLITPFIAGI